jgi:hypothetical protein
LITQPLPAIFVSRQSGGFGDLITQPSPAKFIFRRSNGFGDLITQPSPTLFLFRRSTVTAEHTATVFTILPSHRSVVRPHRSHLLHTEAGTSHRQSSPYLYSAGRAVPVFTRLFQSSSQEKFQVGQTLPLQLVSHSSADFFKNFSTILTDTQNQFGTHPRNSSFTQINSTYCTSQSISPSQYTHTSVTGSQQVQQDLPFPFSHFTTSKVLIIPTTSTVSTQLQHNLSHLSFIRTFIFSHFSSFFRNTAITESNNSCGHFHNNKKNPHY